MRTETILNAMEKVRVGSGWDMDRRIRQYNAFRTRILRMDAEKDEMIAALSIALDASESRLVEILLAEKDTRIDEYRKEIIEKDEEIRMLEETIREMRGFL